MGPLRVCSANRFRKHLSLPPPTVYGYFLCVLRLQLAILAALNEHLRDELDERGQKHSQAIGDLLNRLHVLKTETEQQRALREAGASGPKVTPGFVKGLLYLRGRQLQNYYYCD